VTADLTVAQSPRAERRRAGLEHSLLRAAASEFVATGFLLIAVVGSGIMAERLSGGNAGLALLANALATGGALIALILAFGPRSGAHMNPAVTLAAALTGGLRWHFGFVYIAVQVAGGVAGVWLAHVMFELPVLQLGGHVRTGFGQWVAEAVATFGLLVVIWGCRAHQAAVTAFAVAAYIVGAYWFTASTSFANPAVTVARALTDTFAGIRPGDAPGFILAQALGLVLALPLLRSGGGSPDGSDAE
jgi:glycerol uptake facilitator-like aquaporin